MKLCEHLGSVFWDCTYVNEFIQSLMNDFTRDLCRGPKSESFWVVSLCGNKPKLDSCASSVGDNMQQAAARTFWCVIAIHENSG